MSRSTIAQSLSYLLLAASLAACGATPSTPSADASASTEEISEVTYTASAEEAAIIKSDQPLPPGPIVMFMNGLSCPLCATNIDKQLERLPGVSGVKVDLSRGRVSATLAGPKTPSGVDLSNAADAAGVTLVKVAR